jgi:hypothetical protein
MRRERPRFELGMELHADEPGVVVVFDELQQDAVGRNPTFSFNRSVARPLNKIDVDHLRGCASFSRALLYYK